MTMRCITCLSFILLFRIGATEKYIKWGTPKPCILIDIDATNNLEWINQDGNVTVADNFKFDDADVTEGSCSLPNPYVGGLWPDGKRFELVFYNNTGTADVQMNIYFNPRQVFKHNLTDNVRNIVNFKAGPIGKAYLCRTPTSRITKAHVGKEAYQYTFEISTIQIQGFGVSDGKFSKMVECPDDMPSSKHSTQSTSTHHTNHTTPSTHSTHPTNHTTPSTHSTHPTNHTTHSTHPTNHTTHSTHPTNHTTPSTHSTHSTHPTNHTTPSTHSTHPTNHTTHSTHPTNHTTHSTHSTHSSTPTIHSTLPTNPPLPADHTTPNQQIFNTTCMRMVGKFQFNLSYPTDSAGQNKSALFAVDDIKSFSGQCGSPTLNSLVVTFYNNWQMNITVKTEKNMAAAGLHGVVKEGGLDGAKNVFWWSHLNLQYFYNQTSPDKTQWFPDVSNKYVNRTISISKSLKKKTFQANSDGSYLCNSQTTLNLGGGSSLTVWDLQYTAFNTGPDVTFSDNDVTKCSADSQSKGNTYIYVGVGLAAVVALVMTIYISGRCCYRKNYEEM